MTVRLWYDVVDRAVMVVWSVARLSDDICLGRGPGPGVSWELGVVLFLSSDVRAACEMRCWLSMAEDGGL